MVERAKEMIAGSAGEDRLGDRPGDRPGLADTSPSAPWVETRAGGLFFVNAILAAPVLMALYPWSVRWVLRALGALDRPSRVLDPVPAVADHLIPVLGWLAIPAAWLVIRNLRIVDRVWPRRALHLFLVLHLGTLGYTLLRIFG
ncbi:MAG: hypothetical protein RQ745_04615 [Longimicrobiales bacterium]|nr:hypothetical protein [Longimicrobiales bacterium]